MNDEYENRAFFEGLTINEFVYDGNGNPIAVISYPADLTSK
jgi:hypothetical protein